MTTQTMVTALLATASMTIASAAAAQTPQPASPPNTNPNGTIQTPLGAAPPADRPLIRTPIQPMMSYEAGFGVLGYISGTAALGPSWNVRVTGYLSDRVALEGNYTGSVNRRADLSGRLVYTAIDGGVRYNILTADQAPIQPYAALGAGWVGYVGSGGDLMAMTIPISVGAERLLTQNIKVGARFNLRPSLFENLTRPGTPATEAAATTGGSVWNLIAQVGGAF